MTRAGIFGDAPDRMIRLPARFHTTVCSRSKIAKNTPEMQGLAPRTDEVSTKLRPGYNASEPCYEYRSRSSRVAVHRCGPRFTAV